MKGLTRAAFVWLACGVLAAAGVEAFGAEATEASADDLPGNRVITNTWAEEDQCSASNAVDVRLTEVASDPDRFDGQCVRISGLWSGRALYSDLAGYYKAGPIIGTLPKSAAAYRIGVYGRDEVMERASQPGLSLGTLIGKIGQCEALQGGALMVMGYCHYSYGAYVALSSVESQRPGKFLRQTSDTARRQFGDLRLLTGQWQRRPAIEPLAARWISGIQKSDIADFAALHGITASEIDVNDEEGLLYSAFNATASPFATFRGRQSAPAPVFFSVVQPPPDDPDDDSSPDDWAETVVCFCRESRCDGRWPISKADSWNDSRRPYACFSVQSERRDKDGSIEDRVETQVREGVLAEPPAKPRR